MQTIAMSKGIDNNDWIEPEENPDLKPQELPKVPSYHLIIRPVSVKSKTKGGIIMPDKTKDDIAYLTTVGKVLKLGDTAYKGDKERFPNGAWCKEGDYVCYGRAIGQKFLYKGQRLLLIHDDQVIMVVDDPKNLDSTYNLSH